MNKQLCLYCFLAFLVGYFFKDITGINLIEGLTSNSHTNTSNRTLHPDCLDANNGRINDNVAKKIKKIIGGLEKYKNGASGETEKLCNLTNPPTNQPPQCTHTFWENLVKNRCRDVRDMLIKKHPTVEGLAVLDDVEEVAKGAADALPCEGLDGGCAIAVVGEAGIDPVADGGCAVVGGVCELSTSDN